MLSTVYGLTGDGIQGVGFASVGSAGESALAPRVISQSLNHHACSVGDRHDGAQLVVVQVGAAVGVGACG